MELRHLRYFAALAEQLNFTRAAETVHVTQSTLSHQIKQLETEIGHRLFDRIGKRIVITEAGEQLLGKVKHALSEIDDGLRGVARLGPAVERKPAHRRHPHVQRQPAADLHRHLLRQAPVGSRHRAGAKRGVGRARASKPATSTSASPTGRTARRQSRSSRCATTRWRWWSRRGIRWRAESASGWSSCTGRTSCCRPATPPRASCSKAGSARSEPSRSWWWR